jgi:hypothetical protein
MHGIVRGIVIARARVVKLSLILTSSIVLACSSAPDQILPPEAGNDAPVSVCAADSHVDDAGVCSASIAWTVGADIAIPRNHHMTWVTEGTNAYVYVAGGSNASSQAIADVQRALINSDGTLGAWEEVTPLPAPTIAASVILTHGEVILTGGYSTVATWTSQIQADGSMGPWMAGPKLTGPWFHATGVAFQDFAYVIGGFDLLGNEINQVVRASVADDGTLGPWQSVATLPSGLSHHASVVFGSTLYVSGGESKNGVPKPDVITASLASDGSLGAWATAPSLPYAVETHATFVHDGAIYVAGGIDGNLNSLATITRAPLAPDGTVGTWVVDPFSALPHARSHVHQMPIHGAFIYSVAGAPTGFPSTTAETDIGSFF